MAGLAGWLPSMKAARTPYNPHVHLVIRDRDKATGRRGVAKLSEKGSTERLRALRSNTREPGS